MVISLSSLWIGLPNGITRDARKLSWKKKKLPPSCVYMSLVIILGRDGDTDVGI